MSMGTHTSLAARDTNALKNYQMTRFAGVNIKLRAVYVLISLTHTTKNCRKQATWLSESQHTPPSLCGLSMPNGLSQMSTGPWGRALLLLLYF